MGARFEGSFATLTHARLRARQGDVAGAARILRGMLDSDPDDSEARGLLAELADRVTVAHREPSDRTVGVATPATPGELTRLFRDELARGSPRARRERLSTWLARTDRNRRAWDDR